MERKVKAGRIGKAILFPSKERGIFAIAWLGDLYSNSTESVLVVKEGKDEKVETAV